MTNIARNSALLAAIAASTLTLAGCSAPAPPVSYAAAICVGPEIPDDLEDLVDRDIVRLPDSHCRIGESLPTDENYWAYSEYPDDASDVDVMYVGYPVFYQGSSWSRSRPARVTTLNIQRGAFAEKPAPGVAATSARVPTASAIKRGGLGVPAARASSVPVPRAGVASAARPGTVAPRPSAANTAPRAAAPAPAAAPRKIASAPTGNRGSSSFKASAPAKSGRR